jgi:cytochrome c553
VQPAGRQPAVSGESRIIDGEQLYTDVCSTCHLPTAEGSAEHFIPTLRGQNYSYLLMQMRRFAHGHRFDTPEELLSAFDSMSSAEMEAIASYLSHLPPIAARTATRKDPNAHGEKDSHHRRTS